MKSLLAVGILVAAILIYAIARLIRTRHGWGPWEGHSWSPWEEVALVAKRDSTYWEEVPAMSIGADDSMVRLRYRWRECRVCGRVQRRDVRFSEKSPLGG